jgi:hypothetical protein
MIPHYTLIHTNNSATITTRDGKHKSISGTLPQCINTLIQIILSSGTIPKKYNLLVVSDDKDLVSELNGIGESDLWQMVQLELWRFGNYEVKYEP